MPKIEKFYPTISDLDEEKNISELREGSLPEISASEELNRDRIKEIAVSFEAIVSKINKLADPVASETERSELIETAEKLVAEAEVIAIAYPSIPVNIENKKETIERLKKPGVVF